MSLNPDPDRWNLGTPREWAVWAIGFVAVIALSVVFPGQWFA